jgi:glycine cleavage system H lipoate-binding protein
VRRAGRPWWAREEADGQFTLGLLPDEAVSLRGAVNAAGASSGSPMVEGAPVVSFEVEKCVSHLLAPASGTLGSVNPRWLRLPGLPARDPMGAGWILRFRPASPERFRASLGPLLPARGRRTRARSSLRPGILHSLPGRRSTNRSRTPWKRSG